MSENESGLSNPSRFANYSKLSSQQFFSLLCRHFGSIDLKTYLLDCGSHCRPRKQRAWQPITWPNMFPIYRAIIPIYRAIIFIYRAIVFSYRAIILYLSRDILILSRDKKDVACPLWATVINCYNLLVSRWTREEKFHICKRPYIILFIMLTQQTFTGKKSRLFKKWNYRFHNPPKRSRKAHWR